jgi:LuxR family transcriptional regulator, maltose regulon positive regulatory protein
MDSDKPTPEFLITRLNPPPLGQGFIPRPRLRALLEQSALYALTLIYAPAGSGKSSLLADWARGERNPVAWYSVETADNDPVRFWRYFTAALQIAIPASKFPSPISIAQLGPGVLPGSLDPLCNALAALEKPSFLVLDDFQWIDNGEVFSSLAYLLDHQPGNFHLIMASRTAPLLPLARLRAKNRLLEIRSHELNFTKEEALSFFYDKLDGSLSQEQVVQVADQTRGWAAGLHLMNIALSEDPDQLEAWSAGRKLAAEYLTDEIIDRLPAAWVDFLQKVAVFDPFTVEMAAALTENDQAAGMLKQIQQANLFLEHSGDTFQLHPFFREALLQRLSDAQRKSLHREAAVWFEAHSRPDTAITHSLAGEDWGTAVRLILEQAEDKFRLGEIQTLERWVNALPKEEQSKYPDLQALTGLVLYLSGKIPEAIELEHGLAAPEIERRLLSKGWWAALRCQLALVQENNRLALEIAQKALADADLSNDFIRGILLTSLATAEQASGNADEAVTHFRQAIQVNQRAGNLMIVVFSLTGLGIELNEQGQRLRAMELCDEALIDLTDENQPLSGLIDLLLARLFWEADQLDKAQTALDEASRKLEQLGVLGFEITADIIRVEILTAREEYGEALRLTKLNRRRTRSGEMLGFRRIFDMLRAEISLKMGNLEAVEDWLEGADLPASAEDDPAREMEYVVKARYLVDAGALDEGGRLLETLEGYGRRSRRVRVLISILLNKATLEWKKGELGKVKTCLEEALALAIPQGYIRLLLEGGGLLLGLLAQMPGAPAEIRARFRASHPAGTPELVEMLTAREIDVLRLLAENNTNPEIAHKLVLSPETVKVHLKHIFQKLDVTDRRQAVRRARELEIL